jgi:CheY-like chemotaxis protein
MHSSAGPEARPDAVVAQYSRVAIVPDQFAAAWRILPIYWHERTILSPVRFISPRNDTESRIVEKSFMAASAVIAVIDDDDAIRCSVARLIASRGYRTEAYASAEEFIAKIPRSEATCLVVDVQLEDLSGVELIRHLFSLHVLLPVIFMTGIDDELIADKRLHWAVWRT